MSAIEYSAQWFQHLKECYTNKKGWLRIQNVKKWKHILLSCLNIICQNIINQHWARYLFLTACYESIKVHLWWQTLSFRFPLQKNYFLKFVRKKKKKKEIFFTLCIYTALIKLAYPLKYLMFNLYCKAFCFCRICLGQWFLKPCKSSFLTFVD